MELTQRMYHVSERDDSNSLSFPPRIAFRRSITPLTPPSCESTIRARGSPSTSLIIEDNIAATIAAADRHLASIGLFPRTVDVPHHIANPVRVAPTPDPVLPRVKSASVTPPPVPSSSFHPVDPASDTLPLADRSSHPIATPETRAPPLVGLDLATTLAPEVHKPQDQAQKRGPSHNPCFRR